MKVSNIEKHETLAIVGTCIELSNSEIASVSRLRWDIENSIENAIQNATPEQAKDGNVTVTVDLKTMKRVEWLTTIITQREQSGLFTCADGEYEAMLEALRKREYKQPYPLAAD